MAPTNDDGGLEDPLVIGQTGLNIGTPDSIVQVFTCIHDINDDCVLA